MTYVDFLTARLLLIMALGLIWWAPNTAQIFGLSGVAQDVRLKRVLNWNPSVSRPSLQTVGLAGLVWLCLFSLLGSTPSEFLYFQF